MPLVEIRKHQEILKEIKTELEIVSFDSDELQELCDNLGTNDFQVELDGGEYRFILDDYIEDVFDESIRDLVEDCYITKDMPSLITNHLDWDGIVRDCMVDGYGHHFSGYDGSEHNAGEYYIFRTN